MDARIKRLKQAREIQRYTLVEVSELTGYAVSTLSNVESGRDNASEELIARIVKCFNLEPNWVNTGKGPMFAVEEPLGKGLVEAAITNAKIRLERLRKQVTARNEEVRQLEEWIEESKAALREYRGKRQGPLTKVTAQGNNPAMTLSQLLIRLRSATSVRGKKKELSEFMGVQMPRITEWLAEQREPSGETTLRLLQWVEQEEAKQNGPVSGSTLTEPKAQPLKGNQHENQTRPGPRKR